MEYFSNLLRRVKSQLNKTKYINKTEGIVDLMSWRNPTRSLSSFMILNFILWTFVNSNISVLGLFFIICFNIFILRNIMLFFSIENPQSVICTEHCDKISNALSKVTRFRRENPLEFCFMMSMFFLISAYISNIISGSVICFLILWCAFLIPLTYKNLPPSMKGKLESILSSFDRFQEVIEEDDLIPLPMDQNLEENEDLESLGTDRTADSVTNSLISGLSSMPSFLDAEENQEILEEDLIPTNPQSHELTPSFGDSSDSESELKEIHLKESHFSRESSSDDEGKFEEGLRFEEAQNRTTVDSKGLVHNIVDYMTSAGGFQLSNMINTAMSSMQSTETKNNSSGSSTSDEDFEIIDLEELKK